jgi:MFS family permease
VTSIWALAALRFIASLGIGGEWAAGASLVAEVVPERRRVAAGALLYTSSPFGFLLAGLVADLFTHRLAITAADPAIAWRLVFLSGLVPAAIALWVRRKVREPEAWEQTRGTPPRLAELFTPALRAATIGGLLMSLVSLVQWWGVNAFLPFVVRHLGGPGADAGTVAGQVMYANTMLNAGGVGGALAAMAIARLGRRRMFALYMMLAAAAIWTTFAMDWTPLTRMRLLFPIGFAVFGMAGTFSFYLPELCPTRLRGTGAGFCFNTGRYLAAAGPYIVGHALGVAPTPMAAIRWVALVPVAGLLLVPLVVETAPRGLPRGEPR